MSSKSKKAKPAEVLSEEATTLTPGEAPKEFWVGKFSPQFGFDFEDLVIILASSGLLTTRPFCGRDIQGNLVDPDGRVVIPAQVAAHFKVEPLTPGQRTDG